MFEEKQQENKENFKDARLDIKVSSIKKDSKFVIWLIKYKKVFILFEIIIFFTLSYVFLLGPEFAKLIANKQILSSKEQVLEEAKKLQSKVGELKKERDIVEGLDNQNLKKLYEVLPQKQNLPEIMAQIDALVRKQDLVLGSIQIDNPQESSVEEETPEIDKRIKTIQVSIFVLGGDGSYEKVKELLDALEKHIRLLDITSFSFDPEMTTYSIIFKTYYLD